jgi:hypothetical protein
VRVASFQVGAVLMKQGQEGGRTTILVVDSVTPLLKDLLMGSGSQGKLLLSRNMDLVLM